MAAGGEPVRRVGPGAYQLVLETADGAGDSVQENSDELVPERAEGANGHVQEVWLTSEILQRVAEEARARFLARHPGEADPDVLIREAKRRVAGWIERHGHEPYDEAHLRRLMKTALHDHYRHTQRNGSSPRMTVETGEGIV
jgi:hypothetical protein